MPLSPGSRLGPYEVLAPIGAGGMGEVYRARDPRLRRDVALKVIRAPFATDRDSRARFEREAQALASLRHPHIAVIYGIEEGVCADAGAPVCALALEYIDGETLADRIARAPLPIDEALSLARQIADALDAAHEQGIVHRDLKPANVKITPDGLTKVLDFGLAKVRDDQAGALEAAAAGSSSIAPTVSMASPTLTQAGAILGTAAYMAPEQARGRPADRRADIWAFGAVLYEMLTRRRAFDGDTLTEVAGAVIHKDVDWTALPAGTPAHVRLVLERCLQKDPRDRLRDMGDARLALEGAFTPPLAAAPAPPVRRLPRSLELAAVALLAATVAAAAAWTLGGGEVPAAHPVRFDVPSAPGAVAGLHSLSPDGRHIAVPVRGEDGTLGMWTYVLESGEWRMLTGEAVDGLLPPFWSPDSRFLAFVGGGHLRRMAVAGGPAEIVTEVAANSHAGGAWTLDGAILLATIGSGTAGIVEIPAGGGAPIPLTRVDRARGEAYHAQPWLLPDGRHFLYQRTSGDRSISGIYIGSRDREPDAQESVRVIAATEAAAFAPADRPDAGHVLFLRNGLLMAQPFDARRRRAIGEAAVVLDAPISAVEGYGVFSVSGTGALTFMRGDLQSRSPMWAARDGGTEAIAASLRDVRNPRLSPDGRALALVVEGDVWRYELDGRPPMKLTSGGRSYSPIWTPDGTRLVYEADGESLMIVPADGSSPAEPLGPAGHFHPQAFTPDGDELVVVRMPGERAELLALSMHPDAALRPISSSAANEGLMGAALSPDGRWLAYTSDATGRHEIWVRPYPGPGAGVRVSPGGGIEPVWARDGSELYYLDDFIGQNLMSVSIRPGDSFDFAPPAPVLRADFLPDAPPHYDMAADGRLLVIRPTGEVSERISVVLNWRQLLERRAR